MPLSFAEGLLAPYPYGPVSVMFERFPARLVLGGHPCHELVKVELPEGVARAKLHGFGRVTLFPLILLADHDPGRSVRVEPVDPVNSGRADRLTVDLDDPPNIIL